MAETSSCMLIINVYLASVCCPVVFGYISDVKHCQQNMTAIVETERNFTLNISTFYEPFLELGYFDGQTYYHLCFCFSKCHCFNPRYSGLMNETSNTLVFTIVTITASDSAVYTVHDRLRYRAICIYLHVVDKVVHSNTLEGYIEEGDGIRFNVTNPNVTYKSSHSWKVGSEGLLRWPYVVKGNSLEIKRVTRQFNEVNISYIVFEHNDTSSFNFKLNVAYGPDKTISISPDITFYHVNIGDNLGTVTCKTDCNPDCELTWETFTKPVSVVDSKLILENMKPSFDGEFRCTAKRNGTNDTSARSIYIAVKDIHIEFEPRRSLYHVRIGEIIPSIVCVANCLPVCTLKWTQVTEQTVTEGNTLNVGPLTSGHTGEYICVAEMNGSTVKAERSLFIFAKNEETNTLMILMVSGLICCLIGLLALAVFTVRQRTCHFLMPCEKSTKKNEVQANASRAKESRSVTSMIYSDLKKENQDEEDKYEDLNKDTNEEDYVNVTNHI